MTPPVGFALVTYNKPQQTLRLCERLNDLFGAPPIAVHHDFSQSSLGQARFPANVAFVQEWRATRWASIDVVDALLSALHLLQEKHDPDWVTFLSSSDYPIQDAETILGDLNNRPYDMYMNLHEIRDLGQKYVDQGLGEQGFNNPRYLQTAYNRYVAFRLLKPEWAARIKQPHEAWVVRSKALAKRMTPFGGELRCYGGDSWFTASRRALRVILNQTETWARLHTHFAKRFAPEEGFIHSVVGNAPHLRICHDSLRYTDWRGQNAHPRVLGRSDFPDLLLSKKHFARKFPDDSALLDAWHRALACKRTVACSELVAV